MRTTPKAMCLVALISIAVEGSDLVMTGKGATTTISFDGKTLTVPQHTRQEDFEALAKQAEGYEAQIAALKKDNKLLWENLVVLNDRINKSPHPCTDGSHHCDKSIYGKCFETADRTGGFRCGCVEGYHTLTSYDPATHAPHKCAKITPAPTPAPSPGCVDNVSFYVPAKNDCEACADDCPTGQYRFGCGHGSAGECAACNTPRTNAHHVTNGAHGDASTCEEECDPGYHALGGACVLTSSPTPAPTPVPTIRVTHATYGYHGCRGSQQTHNLGAACNGRRSCYYKVDHRRIGDPSGGCAKSYHYKWCCGDGNSRCHSGRVPPEASFRPGFTMNC